MQPITLYVYPIGPGPNPWKVAISPSFDDVKQSPLLDLNANGRLPAVESGTIANYVIIHKISYHTFPKCHFTQQWLHFQMSGQGPQPIPQPVTIERYTAEVNRQTNVLNKVLEDREWLVGDRCTFADLCFVPWQDMVPFMLGEATGKQPEVNKVLQEKRKAMAEM
ncbi:hypothetical protein BDV25DRAFT_133574 [Aspergillus avenaceus]|uniref:Glutathione S-transferase C-terminal domain-containing protein n=1 Tax=Aspergillus avenaceus TaxID=36643 RepID=A0A5N6THV1_ASPAV|nr:hypothetical protein BDV25DRAFT_133574 [Aspergillus avenaceus]